jgi:hypothetical protein
MQDYCIEKIIMSIRNIFLKCIFVEKFVLKKICIEELTILKACEWKNMKHRFARRAIEIGGLVPSAPKYDLVILNSCKNKLEIDTLQPW